MKTVSIVRKASVTLMLSLFLSALWSAQLAAQDKIPKFLLIKLSRDQSAAMCASEAFTQCMGFTAKACVDLAELAIEKCIAPLPEEIDPKTLENSTLEACPQEVYKEGGFTEEKAKMCFDKAMESAKG